MSYPNLLRHFLAIRKEQWLSPEELLKIQEKKLSKMLACASKTKFYSGMEKSPDPFSTIRSLPITRKPEIQKDPSAFLTCGRENLFEMRTSGSTGEPLRVYEGKGCLDYGIALRYMNLLEIGRRPQDLLAEISHKKHCRTFLQSVGVFRQRMLSIYDDEETNYGKLCRMKPDILGFYPSVLSSIARINLERGRLRLKSVFCGAEPLSETARKTISESFSCPVFNLYGTTEFGPVAWECPEEHSLHVNAGSVYLEILDGNGRPKKDGEGALAMTTLRNDAMPLLRYDIGDRASWGEECPCGRGLPVLKTLEGRADDLITLPSGRVRSALSVNLMDDLVCLKAFQIAQETESRFLFRYVPLGRDISPAQKNEIRQRLVKGCLGEEISVEFERAEKIQRGPGGKLSTVISRVPPKEI
jgi:phenylacetate-CoA ligase